MNKKFSFLLIAGALGWLGTAVVAAPNKSESGIDPAALDRTVDPCTDFYQFACGNWIKQQTLPAGYSRWTRSFNTIDDDNLSTLKNLLEAYANGGKAPAIPAGKKVGDFYASCVDTNAAQQVTTTVLPQELAAIDQIQKPEQLAPALAKLHAKGVDAFFSFFSDRDQKNASQVIAVVDRGGLGLPDRDYYLNTSAESAALRAKYVAHVAKTLALSGVSVGDAEAQAAAIMKLETTLAQNGLSLADRRDPAAVYHPTTYADLKTLASGFDWDAYFAATGAPKFTWLNVAEPALLREVGALLAGTSLADARAYLRWQYLKMASSKLGKAFVDEDFDFFGRTLSGQAQPKERWKTCVESVSGALGEAVGEAYVKTSFSEASKEQTRLLVENLHKAVAANFAAVTWMDEPTREQAQKKLQAILKKIGYPDTFKDYSSVTVTRGSYLQNSEQANAFAVREVLAKIGKPSSRDEWEMTPQTVNAYYEPTLNEIVFPAAILQQPFYNVSNSLAWNYGGIGMVIGHETTHAFDDQGRHYDGTGNLTDWWTPQAAAQFEERASCLAKQYDAYTVAGGVHLNGKQTLGENIADLGGLKLAFAAYQQAKAGQSAAPDFAGFTDDQQFFVAFAQDWCTKATPEYEQLQAKTDVHSNSRYRVNGVVVNVPAFQQAFSCQTGSAMAPANRCVIW